MFRDGIHDVTLSDHWGLSALLVLAVEMVNNNDYVDHRPNDCARTLIPFIICVVHFQCSENANNSAHYSTECTSSYLCVKYDDICEIGCPVPALLIRKKYSTHSQNTHWNHFKCKHLLSSLIPFSAIENSFVRSMHSECIWMKEWGEMRELKTVPIVVGFVLFIQKKFIYLCVCVCACDSVGVCLCIMIETEHCVSLVCCGQGWTNYCS